MERAAKVAIDGKQAFKINHHQGLEEIIMRSLDKTTIDTSTQTQIFSKQRVQLHGEVFTGQREVENMIALVEHETDRIESRFLEPACGTGNFLRPILEKKLSLVKKRYRKSQLEFERVSAVAVGSVYGVELLGDNVFECRKRLFNLFDEIYSGLYGENTKEQLRNVIRFILSKNIVIGDALSLKTNTTHPKPIVFSEWSLVNGSYVKRRDYEFEELLSKKEADQDLFTEMQRSDMNELVFVPRPTQEYPLMHVLDLANERTS